MLFGNNQNMNRRLGMKIFKRHQIPFVKNDLGRDLFPLDFAEKTIAHGRIIRKLQEPRNKKSAIPGRFWP